jgi:hypothetical protein
MQISDAGHNQLERKQQRVEVAENRLLLHRDELASTRERQARWRAMSALRICLAGRARTHGRPKLANAWSALAQEATDGADLEGEQALSLESRIVELEAAARCARSDVEEFLQRERP